jgi:hypothetical protein
MRLGCAILKIDERLNFSALRSWITQSLAA